MARSALALVQQADAGGELAAWVATGRELGRRQEERRRASFPTGLAALDRLLAGSPGETGGLPRGRLVELVGRPGGGRFTAALTALATATAAGEAAALVDLGDQLDPEDLAALGAELERLLWLRPENVKQTLAAAEAVLAGGLPLVVIDLGLPPVRGGRGLEAGWVRLARAAEAHGAALLVSAPYRVSGTAAHAVVTAERGTARYAAPAGAGLAHHGTAAPPLLAGLDLCFRLDKCRGRREGERARQGVTLAEAWELPQPAATTAGPPAGTEAGDGRHRSGPALPGARRAAAEEPAGRRGPGKPPHGRPLQAARPEPSEGAAVGYRPVELPAATPPAVSGGAG